MGKTAACAEKCAENKMPPGIKDAGRQTVKYDAIRFCALGTLG